MLLTFENDDTDGKYGCIYADTLTISNANVAARAFYITRAEIAQMLVNYMKAAESYKAESHK